MLQTSLSGATDLHPLLLIHSTICDWQSLNADITTFCGYLNAVCLHFKSRVKLCGKRAGKGPLVQTLTFEQSAGSSTKELAMQRLALDSTSDAMPNEGDSGDDLLDLLDSVAWCS